MRRRSFLRLAGTAGFGLLAGSQGLARAPREVEPSEADRGTLPDPAEAGPLTLFLCGDVMTGRGIDQVLPHPVDPRLRERWVKSALGYVALAERANGPIKRPVAFPYVWGDALGVLERMAPEARLVNLETAVTTSDDAWPDKGIHYRMHPKNVGCLTAAGIDCCVLANNHVLDWGRAGLAETLDTLRAARIGCAGAGRDVAEAEAPAALPTRGAGRVLVVALGHPGSGIPSSWAAAEGRPGVNLVRDLTRQSVLRLARGVREASREGDVVVVSIHWGGNWGYAVPEEQRRFARALIDDAGAAIVHGHSSHHPKGLEVYRGRLILYGCGDFINDYEGISGYEEYRDDLVLMYLPRVDRGTGRLLSLRMVPLQLRRFRLRHPAPDDVRWLARTLDRECRPFGCRVEENAEGALDLRWEPAPEPTPPARG